MKHVICLVLLGTLGACGETPMNNGRPRTQTCDSGEKWDAASQACKPEYTLTEAERCTSSGKVWRNNKCETTTADQNPKTSPVIPDVPKVDPVVVDSGTGSNPAEGLFGAIGNIFSTVISNAGSNGSSSGQQTQTNTTPDNSQPAVNTQPATQPVQQPAAPQTVQQSSDACSNSVNATVELGGPGSIVGNRGVMDISILAPLSGSQPRLGQPHANFNGFLSYYQSSMVRGGQRIWGTLTLRGQAPNISAVVILNGQTLTVGSVSDTDQGPTVYPRKARINFTNGACLTQYKTAGGDLFSGGAGYLVLP